MLQRHGEILVWHGYVKVELGSCADYRDQLQRRVTTAKAVVTTIAIRKMSASTRWRKPLDAGGLIRFQSANDVNEGEWRQSNLLSE